MLVDSVVAQCSRWHFGNQARSQVSYEWTELEVMTDDFVIERCPEHSSALGVVCDRNGGARIGLTCRLMRTVMVHGDSHDRNCRD